MKRALVCLLAGAMVAGFAATVASAGTQDNAKVVLHLQVLGKGQLCDQAPAALGCDALGQASNNVVDVADLGESYAMFIVIEDFNVGPGIGGLSMGLQYDSGGLGTGGLALFGDALCADNQFASILPNPEWPDDGSGNVFTWDTINNCQTTVDADDPQGEGIAMAGAYYLFAYSPDTAHITGRSYLADPDLKVSDCNASESDLEAQPSYPMNVGKAGFGTGDGFDPCADGIATESTTWGGIKNLFDSK